ncbi:Immature colon carcinoma transcript 1 protein [Zea mays]|uniref:Immature colon carcinoma transcript 1 protein n=1 Tax=Zea mays TaxID=4577 RepID=A0A1D6JW28_MAIZE|nr:Immature colon carcinoma transcript 1 protein [Zea mays]
MATAMRGSSLLRFGFRHPSCLLFQSPRCPAPSLGLNLAVGRTGLIRLRCSAAGAGDAGGKKVSARLALTQQVLRNAEERAASAGSDPAPKITLDHVTVNFARSGGPGGQNVNKVNTKVDMRFNVKEAHWLGERIKERILQAEKNRINKDGELVISSTKTRTQKQSLMLHHMFLHPQQKTKRKRLKKLLQLLKGRDFRIRRCFHRRRNLDGTELAGIDARYLAQTRLSVLCHSAVGIGNSLEGLFSG